MPQNFELGSPRPSCASATGSWTSTSGLRSKAPKSAYRFVSSPLLALALIACGGSPAAPVEPFEPTPTVELATDELDAAIDAVGAFILRHTLESGRFTYVLDGDGKSDPKKYNVLRHGGTVYAMGELRRHRGGSAELDAAIARSAAYLVKHHVGSFEKPRGIGGAKSLAIWSRLGEEIRGEHRAAKLGGAGLGLVALTTAYEVDPSSVELDVMRGLGLTIAAMQKDDGHFVSKVIEDVGIDPDFVSLYYPGEAVLGLARLYRIDRDERWIKVAGRAIEALIKMRTDLDDDELPADHWLLIAIGELADLVREVPETAALLPVSIDVMITHAVRIADAMLAEQRAAGADGSFNPARRSTPTATRLEGIFALLRGLPEDHAARPRLELGARAGTSFLLTCRVRREGTRLGGITRKCPPRRTGRSAEIRIDYAQHALSAFIGARAL